MLHVEIRRPVVEDRVQVNEFFKTVVTDTFTKEGIGDKLNEMKNEIETKGTYLESDFASNGEKRYFLIAYYGDTIIGSIEYGPVSDLIKKWTTDADKNPIEIGTVFVHPNFQKKGVGNLLLQAVYATLQKNGITEFYLDSGYHRAQSIWIKKFSDPHFVLKDYWGTGHDHMIWRIQLNDCITD
ncbi:GNAT family N-acetyltransferase [Shouchella patagoniensis]|uniref:GNAT family N-acetyltransferase n=1 Tax=Shouchella patagoniensis TaxID=228576 RepID=UPI000994D2C9|nr:GNAT family N-acetyltransferase [Shouchella patagoniensis]